MNREDLKKGIYILPNLFTTGNLLCGFFAITSAINEDYVLGAWVVLLATVFDFLDGRVARLTNTQSEFGLQYDSLVDLVSFGMAPAILMYKWTLFHYAKLGWAIAFVFFACGALRLARFNVQAQNEEENSFQGLPIPAAASLMVASVIMHHHVFGAGEIQSLALLGMTGFLALLMVSNIRYPSFKKLDRTKKVNFFVLVLVVGLVFFVALDPQVMLFVLTLSYVVIGLIIELIRSPLKIKNFADFMKRFFQASPNELLMDDLEPKAPKKSKKVAASSSKPKKQNNS